MLKLLVTVIFAFLCVVPAAAAEEAEAVAISAWTEPGETLDALTDDSYDTVQRFEPQTVLRITPQNPGQKLYGLYLRWAEPPQRWYLHRDGITTEQGKDGFLHEYVPLGDGADSVSLEFPEGEKLCDVTAYSDGVLPADVQVWQPPCDRADILLFPAHADDEILFFGAILAEYAGERGLNTQVAYFSQYDNVREHEKLDGLWACGVGHYPVCAGFRDVMPGSRAEARELFPEEEVLEFYVEQLRRFRPQVCVAHDVNGEYGHETHKYTSAMVRKALELSADPTQFPNSAAAFGTWDVPKTYLHLWRENPIRLDCRKPLSRFGGRTALEVAAEAYKKHVSQQWCWFYVSDDYKYSIADFGLCRSTVGTDTGNDLMERLTPYARQAKPRRRAPVHVSGTPWE